RRASDLADGGDDFHLRNYRLKNHVKPDLVIARTGTSVSYRAGVDLFSVFRQSLGLDDPLGAYGEGIGVVFKHVPEYQVFYHFPVIIVPDIQDGKGSHRKLDCPFLYLLQFFFLESAGVYQYCMDLITFFLAEVKCAKCGVQTTAVSQYYFFHLNLFVSAKFLILILYG